jgi:predicted small lipoprotein YifL
MKQTSYVVFAGAGLILLTVVAACGVVGPPVPPEDVGVNPTITRQKAQLQKTGTTQPTDNAAAPAAVREAVEPKGQDEDLPSLRPVGTR